MGDMTPNIKPFESNTLFNGGSDGDDTAIMLGKYPLGGASKKIGNSGLYVGGLREAKKMTLNGEAHPYDFKFFYKSVVWTTSELMADIERGMWKCFSLGVDEFLEQSYDYLQSKEL